MILSGEYPVPDDLPDEANDLLMEMRRPSNDIYEIKPCTSFDDFKEYIRTVDEKRSSSSSGSHYGHYKTLLDNNDKCLQIIHGVLEIALQHGVVLDR